MADFQAEVVRLVDGGLSAAPTKAFRFVAVGDLEIQPPEFVVDDLIEADSMVMFFGDPACAKTFVAVDVAASVAAGSDFHGHQVKQGAVFFIAGEGHGGLARRFAAWATARKQSLKGVPLFKSERAAQFLDEASAKAVVYAVDALAEEHGTPRLIVVDTVARNFGGGDESSTQDMGAFIAAIDAMRANYPGCTVLLVHHTGHQDKNRARGSMALKSALDAEFRVEKDGPGVQLINTKMKEAEPPPDLYFTLRQVELGQDITSAVLDTSGAPAKRERMTPAQQMAIGTYKAAAVDSGHWDGDHFQGVHLDDWRACFYANHTGDTPDAKQKAFQRVRRDLTDAGKMTVSSDVYLTTDSEVLSVIALQRPRTPDSQT